MKYILIIALVLASISLFALGEKNISINGSDLVVAGTAAQDASLIYNNNGSEVILKKELNLLRNRNYILNINASGNTSNITCEVSIKFMYKYGSVGEFNKEVNFKGTFVDSDFTISTDRDLPNDSGIKTPIRLDKSILQIRLAGTGSLKLNKINLTVSPEPVIYGHIIDPIYKGIMYDKYPKKTIVRYFSNHEELGINDADVSIKTKIVDSKGKPVFTNDVKGILPEGYVAFETPQLPVDKYTLTCNFTQGDKVLGTISKQFEKIATEPNLKLYVDGNGRLIYDNKPFMLLGLKGNMSKINIDKVKSMGINTLVTDKPIANIENIISLENKDLASIKEIVDTTKDNTLMYMLYSNINFTDLPELEKKQKLLAAYNTLNIVKAGDGAIRFMGDSDFLGLDISAYKNDTITKEIKGFFGDYGFYSPLINVIDIHGISEPLKLKNIIWQNLCQTQTGLIFNFDEDINSINLLSDIVKEISSYNSIFLSNAEPKVSVFGNVVNVLRKKENTTYIFAVEINGRADFMDFYAPNKKSVVSINDSALSSNDKSGRKYTVNFNPFETKVIKIVN